MKPATFTILLIAIVIVRGGFLLTQSDNLNDDPDAYRVIAETLAETGVFGLPIGGESGNMQARATAFRPPLYPWLLSWFVDDSGSLSNRAVAGLQFLLGGLTVFLTYDIARRLLTTCVAWIAAGLVLIDPILLWQSSLIMTETIATALTSLLWWWWVVRFPFTNDSCNSQSRVTSMPLTALVLGGILTLAILCRPTFLVWTMMIIASMIFVGPSCRIRRAAMIGITIALIVAGVGAWTLRNVVAVGHPVWGTTHGGYTLLLANNDSFYDYLETKPTELPWRSHAWDADDFFAQYDSLPRSGDEYEDDQVAYAAAKATIERRRAMFWYSCWVRWTRLWQPFPHAVAGRSTTSILVVGGLHSLLYGLIVFAAVRHREKLRWRGWRKWIPLWPAIALLITLSGVHAVYWSNPRMRSPAIPMLAIAAASVFASRQTDRPQQPISTNPL